MSAGKQKQIGNPQRIATGIEYRAIQDGILWSIGDLFDVVYGAEWMLRILMAPEKPVYVKINDYPGHFERVSDEQEER